MGNLILIVIYVLNLLLFWYISKINNDINIYFINYSLISLILYYEKIYYFFVSGFPKCGYSSYLFVSGQCGVMRGMFLFKTNLLQISNQFLISLLHFLSGCFMNHYLFSLWLPILLLLFISLPYSYCSPYCKCSFKY